MSRLKTMAGACVFCGFSIAAALNSYPTREDKERLAAYRAAEEAEFLRVAALLMPDQYALSHDCSAGHQAQAHNVSDDDAADSSSYAHWSVRGAWEDDFFCVFPSGWLFPYGGGHWDHVWVDSRGALWLNTDDEQPVVGFDVPVSHVPGVSSFEHGLTPSNTYVFAWQGVAENRDGNQLTERRIELCRNGDAIVSTNGVSSTIPYEIPFEHDGYGQDEAWVRANFTRLQRVSPSLTNAEEIISIGYTNWVAQQVGVGLLNGLYMFSAEFLEDPPEPTLLYIGDCSVCVTRAGVYSFVLEKGTEYEFGTWPFNDAVDYWAQDDMADDAPMLTARLDGTTAPGAWTVDGGWSWLWCPSFGSGRYSNGYCAWWPTLQGSPGVVHLNESDFPKLFSAIVSDYPHPDELMFFWASSDEHIQIDSPLTRQTMVSVDSMPSWQHFDLSVSTVINGQYLYSTIGSCSYGTNEFPQVRLGLSVPKGIPLKSARLPASYSFECDVETNGWLVLECTSSTNRVSLWQSATNDVAFVCSNKVDYVSSRSSAFYVYGENRSRSYEDVIWKLSFLTGTGETNAVSSTSTVFGCYCQPVMDTRIPDGTNFYNPYSIKVGTNAWFRADVVPLMPTDKIVWRAITGSVQFPDGTNGQRLRVAGSSPGDATLGVTVLDYTDERMKFELEVVE